MRPTGREGPTMWQVAITGSEQVELMGRDVPVLRPGWALVKILAAPLCAEYKLYRSGRRLTDIGHEAAGEVVEVAPGSMVAVGDRVVVMPQYSCGVCALCRAGDYIYCQQPLDYEAGALSQYIAKPSWLLPRLPDTVSMDAGSLACCGLGPSFGALERLGVDRFSTVLVTGLGPVGLGAVINAAFRGARVIGVEANPYRARLAKDLGADLVLDPHDPDIAAQIMAATEGRGIATGVECAGVIAAHRLQIEVAAPRAHIVFVGECPDPTPIRVSPDLIRHGLVLEGSWHYNLNLVPRVLRVAQEAAGIRRFVTHTFGRAAIQAAFEVSSGQRCGKVIWHPWQEDTDEGLT